MSNYNNNTINPKPCNYGCNARIYWKTTENAYLEVFAKKKHICPNRSNNSKSVTQSTTNTTAAATNNKPNYYNKFAKQPKPKMPNSFELLRGPIIDVQKYEILSDIVSEANGKVHGSQSHIVTTTNNNSTISLIVYYEVPEGKREK